MKGRYKCKSSKLLGRMDWHANSNARVGMLNQTKSSTLQGSSQAGVMQKVISLCLATGCHTDSEFEKEAKL